MTTETRYMRSDVDSGYYKLLTTNTSTYTTHAISESGELVTTIAVRIKDQDGNVLVDWQQVDVIDDTYTLYTINANVPATEIESIIVEVRVCAGGTCSTRSFKTDAINQEVSGTWNFKLWARYGYSVALDITTCYFRHGSSTYNSRVENFTYNPPTPPVEGGILAQII